MKSEFKAGDILPSSIVLVRPLAPEGEAVHSMSSEGPVFIRNLRGALWFARDVHTPEAGLQFVVCTDGYTPDSTIKLPPPDPDLTFYRSLLVKLPPFNSTWDPETQKKWLDNFTALLSKLI